MTTIEHATASETSAESCKIIPTSARWLFFLGAVAWMTSDIVDPNAVLEAGLAKA